MTKGLPERQILDAVEQFLARDRLTATRVLVVEDDLGVILGAGIERPLRSSHQALRGARQARAGAHGSGAERVPGPGERPGARTADARYGVTTAAWMSERLLFESSMYKRKSPAATC